TFTSSVNLTASAIRIFTTERGDPVITALPLMRLDVAGRSSGVTIAHFADGGGWKTEVVLLNRSDQSVDGSVQFILNSGQVLQTSPYTVPASSSVRIAVSASGGEVRTGFVRVSGLALATALVSFVDGGSIVTQTALPAVGASTGFRMYAEAGSAVRTGVAIANPSAAAIDVKLNFAGFEAPLSIPANSQKA